MTLQEKLDLFYQSAIEDASEQKSQLLREYQESLDNTYKKFKRDARVKAEAVVQSEEEHLKREKNEVLSHTMKSVKKELAEATAKYCDEVFQSVDEKLVEYMQTEEYEDFLVEKIKEAVQFARKEEMTIYINASDEDKKKRLEKKSGAVLTVSSIDFMGGVRAVVHAKNVLIDHSFTSGIEEQREGFSI